MLKSPKKFEGYKSESDNDHSQSANLTGSPLQDDLSINEIINSTVAPEVFLIKPWDGIEETYTPINIERAREILLNLQNNHSFPKDLNGWIYILCSDESAPLSNTPFLLSGCINSNQFVRGLGQYHGVIKHEKKSMEKLLKRHYSLIPPNTKLNTQMESCFNITHDVSLKFVNTTSVLSPPMDHIDETSKVVLYQVVEIGKSHVLCEDFWSEINLLNMIKLDIISSKNNSCDGTISEPSYNFGDSDSTFEKLQQKVNRILTEVNVELSLNNEDTGEGTVDIGLESVIKRARHRPITEVSDSLWDLLKYTGSYSDLKKIFTFIFQIASRSNIVNIPMNQNRLSEVIRELTQQRLAIPHLVGTEPLELLLEIGIEKLMKDYDFILAESKICNLSDMKFGGKSDTKLETRLSVRKSLAAAAVDLNQSERSRKTLLKTGSNELNDDEDFGVKNSRFNESMVESKISKLAQVHLVVEHLLLIQNNLTIENDYIWITKKLFEKPLLPFDDLQYQKYDKFEVDINDKKVMYLVDNLVPNSQKFILQSANKFKDVTSVFNFNIEQTVPSLVKKENESDAVDKSGNSFHFISYSAIKSKF